MTHIPVIVKVVDEVVPSGSKGEVMSCVNCRSLLFYQVTTQIKDTENATDICTYCAVCGQSQGGFVVDPSDEMKAEDLPRFLVKR